MAKKVEAVIFDQDGFMFDTEWLVLEGWGTAAAEYNMTFEKDFLRDLRGTKPDKVKEAFIRKYGPDIDSDSVCEEKRLYSYHWVKKNGAPVKPGFKELLEYLKLHNIRTAVVTASGRERTQGNVKSAGVEGYFDHYIYRDMAEEVKPNPAILLLTAGTLGEDPEKCMVLEDSFNGIRTVYAGGFLPVMVPDQDEPDEELSGLLAARCDVLPGVIGLFRNGALEY